LLTARLSANRLLTQDSIIIRNDSWKERMWKNRNKNISFAVNLNLSTYECRLLPLPLGSTESPIIFPTRRVATLRVDCVANRKISDQIFTKLEIRLRIFSHFRVMDFPDGENSLFPCDAVTCGIKRDKIAKSTVNRLKIVSGPCDEYLEVIKSSRSF